MLTRTLRRLLISAVTVVAAGGVAAPAQAAEKPKPQTYKNCTALNIDYPHGVGVAGAIDRVTGKTKPVTTFKQWQAQYEANKKSDRDKDGIACEKR